MSINKNFHKISFSSPNVLSALRILLIIPIIFLLKSNQVTLAFVISVIAFLTDFVDGRLARGTGQVTLFGSILDAVADKLIILALMAYFMFADMLDIRYFSIVAFRDIGQLCAIPILMGLKGIHFKVAPKLIPKFATALKYVIIGILFLGLLLDRNLSIYLNPFLIISGLLEIFILVAYLKRFFEIYEGTHDTFE